MFSTYWEDAYGVFFYGSAVLTPVLHPETDLTSLSKIGLALSHGYLVSGFLPTALPSMGSILLGNHVELPWLSLLETA